MITKHHGITVKQAREVMAKALSEDEGLFRTYEAAIAMYLHDNLWHHSNPNMKMTDDYFDASVRADKAHEARNKAAEDLLNLLFSG